MRIVQVADHLFEQAQRRAAQAGFASVEEYVSEILHDDLRDENFDHLFTPERLAALDRISRQKPGTPDFSIQEVQEHFAKKQAAWPRKPGS